MSGRDIVDALRIVHESCESIRDGNACDGCPLKGKACVYVDTFEEVADDATMQMFDDLISFANDVADKMSDEDWDAYWSDRRREDDYDKRWGYAEYGY